MPGTYDIAHYKGDTFRSIIFKFIKNNVILDLTDYSFLIQFRKGSKYAAPSLEWSLNNGCHVSDPTTGELVIDEQIIDIAEGIYFYDIQMTNTVTSEVLTYIEGKLTITQDISRNN